MAEKGFSVKLSARVDQYLGAMGQAAAATKNVSAAGTDLDKLGGQFTKVGSTLTSHVSLPLVAAAGVAVKFASDFESAFARMVGLAGVQADEVDGLKEAVLDLAGKTAQAPQDLADALYEASSAGLTTAQAMEAVTIAAKASASGMGTAKDVVGLVASATASYGAANITAAHAADILTSTIRAGRADPAELAGSLGRILPVAAQLGISFEQVGGATAYLSNILGDTNRTVTALSGIFNKLVAPTEQGRKALKEMGGSAEELSAAVSQDGLTGALDYLRSHGFDKNSQALRAVFDDVEAFNGILALLNDKSGTLTSTMDATAASTGSLDEAFKGASDTAGFKMKQAWADVQVALIQAGDIIMPIVSGIAGAISDLVAGFSDLPGPVQTIVVAFLALVAAAGPVLMVAGSMIKNFNQVKMAMANMGPAAGVAGAAFGVAAVALFAYQQGVANAAKRQGEFNASITELSRVSDEALGKAMWQTMADGFLQVALDGKKMSEVFDGIAQSNLEGAKRALEWAVANGQNKNVIDGLTAAIAKEDAAVKQAAATTAEYGVSADGAAVATAKQTAAFNDWFGVTKGGVPVIEELVLSEEELAAIAKEDAAATKELSKALDTSTNSFEILASAASLLKQALDAVFAPAQTLEDANQALVAAVDATTQAFIDNGRTLDINTKQGRVNRDAIQDQANAAIAQGVAMVGMGGSTAEATDAINWQIAALRNQMLAAGLTEDQVNDYITTLGLTPENVDTAITLADTEATKVRIQGLLDQLGDIDAGAAAEIEALIDAGKFADAEAALEEIAHARNVKINLVKGVGWFGELKIAGGNNFAVAYAAGGTPPGGSLGGPTWVGERGRELLDLPRGSVVHSNYESMQMVSAASQGMSSGRGGSSAASAPSIDQRSINFHGGINSTIDMNAAWQQANFALMAMS